MNKIKAFIYKANRLLLILVSILLSYLYYSSFTSVLFFSIVFGLTAVFFDIAKVQLIDSKKRTDNIIAFLFVLFSVVAAAGVSLNELESAVQSTDNTFFADQIKKDIELLDNQIIIQSKRIENTSTDFATAAQKENAVYNELLERKQALVKELEKYNKDVSLTQTKITPYITISKLTGLPVRLVMLIYFFLRAVLIEVGIVFLKDKEKLTIEQETALALKYKNLYKEAEKPDVNDNVVIGVLSRLEQASTTESSKIRIETLQNAFRKLVDFKNKKLYEENK